MYILVCVDDTDDLSKATSTGRISQHIESALLEAGLAQASEGITRHQLLLDERIAYTSHNSSMCIKLKTVAMNPAEWQQAQQRIAALASEVILREKAEESDPGLCICCPELINKTAELVNFGLAGQKMVLSKQQAYQQAEDCGVWLRELGGDGAGVIGALCGVGLRLSGYDGWFRGKLKTADYGIAGTQITAAELGEKLACPVLLQNRNQLAGGQELVDISPGIKMLLWKHRRAIAIRPLDEAAGLYQICNKRTLTNSARLIAASCEGFVPDNDEEEFMQDSDKRSCFNCLYRRWTADGFICRKNML